jgi:hypothetical protein
MPKGWRKVDIQAQGNSLSIFEGMNLLRIRSSAWNPYLW